MSKNYLSESKPFPIDYFDFIGDIQINGSCVEACNMLAFIYKSCVRSDILSLVEQNTADDQKKWVSVFEKAYTSAWNSIKVSMAFLKYKIQYIILRNYYYQWLSSNLPLWKKKITNKIDNKKVIQFVHINVDLYRNSRLFFNMKYTIFRKDYLWIMRGNMHLLPPKIEVL